jgi:hypothetical protein
MEKTAPLFIYSLFSCTASAASQSPFLLQEKEQAEVRQSLTLGPYATATGSEEFSGNSLAIWNDIKLRKGNSHRNSGMK